MKLLVSYSNCQGQGVIHFLRKSPLAETFEFRHYNNYQLILKEQSSVDLFRDAACADVFFHQPTPAIQYCELSTEDMIDQVVPKAALKLSFGYGFNHGFFPLVHHGQWQTGEEVRRLAREVPAELLSRYDHDDLSFACQERFLACLSEQRRREERDHDDILMCDWIAANYRKHQLFLCENHPASAYLAEVASKVSWAITGQRLEMPFTTNNDANLPCGLLVHPAVVRELRLGYSAEPGAVKFFRDYLVRLIVDSKPK